MTLTLNTANLIFIVVALLGAFWGLLKLLVAQHERSLDKRFAELSKTITDNTDLTTKLEKDLMRLQEDIPRTYLRREDYLRESQAMVDNNQRQFDPILKSLARIEDYLLRQKP
jgi:septal ring factor EnvC (AmiA/AmiB activator)